MARKYALVVGNSRYDDPSLERLKTPDVDVPALESVLKAPDIGQFDEVITLHNEGVAAVRKAIAVFYDQRKSDDLLFFYFSGHGVKDEQGHLYLALRDTELSVLAGTAVETAFVSGRMDRSYSKRQVVVLDCCHSGAFAHGTKGAQGASVGTAEAFEGTGLGRVILTATDATQYAWEGDHVTGNTEHSLFTHYLIDGLRTGAADQDGDGVITVDELYNYVRDRVLLTTPRQTPLKWTYRQQGSIILAQNPFATPAVLPATLAETVASKLSNERLEAVRELAVLLRSDDAGQSRAALAALKELSQDDSRKVVKAATDALTAHRGDQGALAEEASKPIIPVPDKWRQQPNSDQADDRPDNRPSDVFLSYAHEDREAAKALAGVLTSHGWRVWWDRKIAPGESFDLVIERELRNCKCAIVLWSVNSVEATWVRNEARRAARRQVLVPILIHAVEPPLEFENLQAADLTSWQPPASHPELDTVLGKILQLAPIPPERLARIAAETAWQQFARGDQQGALASLVAFRPEHPVVTAALTELRAEVRRVEHERAEAAREAAEAARLAKEEADRQQALDAERIERDHAEVARLAKEEADRQQALEAERIEHERLEAARQAVEAARLAKEEAARQQALEAEGIEHERVEAARQAVEAARLAKEEADRQQALEAERIEHQRAEAARQAVEAARLAKEEADRQAALEAERIERERIEAVHQAAERVRREQEEAARQHALAEKRRAQQAVKAARQQFAAGEHTRAIAGLAEYQPPNVLVTGALAELRAEARQIEDERAEVARRAAETARKEAEIARSEQEEASRQRAELVRLEQERIEAVRQATEAADRQRALEAGRQHIASMLVRGDLEAVERALDAAESQFGKPEFIALRKQWAAQKARAAEDVRAQQAVDAARQRFASGDRDETIASLSAYRPAHPLVKAALTELRAEAKRIEHERAEAVRRAAEEARRADEASEEAGRAKEVAARRANLAEQARSYQEAAEHTRRQKDAAERLEQASERERRATAAGEAKVSAEADAEVEAARRETEGQAAPPDESTATPDAVGGTPPPARAIYLAAGVAVVVTVLAAGIWWGTKPPHVADTPANPSVTKQSDDRVLPKPSPADVTQPTPQAPVDTTPSNEETTRSRELDAFRRVAGQQLKAGKWDESLTATMAGLRLDPGDATLTGILGELLRASQAASDRAKQEATSAGRGLTRVPAFADALQKEAAAVNARRAGHSDVAVRSYRTAVDAFATATGQYNQLASAAAREKDKQDKERQAAAAIAAEQKRQADATAEQARLAEERRKEAESRQTPQAPQSRTPPGPRTPSDEERIRQILADYAAAFSQMNFSAIVALHPGVSPQVGDTFKQMRSYTMRIRDETISVSVNTAVVTCTIETEAEPRQGRGTERSTRRTTLRLEKRTAGWIIVDRR